MKQLKKVKYGFVITLLVFSALFSVVPVVNVRADIDPADIIYSWELDTFSAHVGRVWNDTNFLLNESGSINDVFNHSYGYAISEEEWIEEESVFSYNVNYSYYSNLTLTGDSTIDVDFDVYKVDISYGSSVYFIWVGFKNGTFYSEYNVNNMTHDFSFENSFYKKSETTYRKYNLTTMELLETWDETIEDSGDWLSEDTPASQFTIHNSMEIEFSMPLILTFQVYETQNGEKVAWADMISDFYVFNDKDDNGVYSVGETETAPNHFYMGTSDEYCGAFIPWAFNQTTYIDYWSPTTEFNSTSSYKFPGDTPVGQFGESIQFTPPKLNGNEVEWNIKYPDFPIYAVVSNYPNHYMSPFGTNYSDLASGNFSYGYNYEITNETAGLDLTAHLPRINQADFFNAAQNLSLAFPHYTYFLSSAAIEESESKILTIPSNMFQFNINDTKVAEIDMESEFKKNYTLMDYPTFGTSRTIEAIGSSVSRLVADVYENNPLTPRNWFVDTIFTLGDLDLVKLDPEFDNATSLYTIEMQNYPTWSGYELIHDPTLTIYHYQQKTDDTIPVLIPGYNLCVIAGIIGVISVLIARKKKFYKKSKFQL
jgi:hypothetical protein